MMPSAYLLLWETSYCSFLMYSKCIFHPAVCCPAYENILKSSKFFPVLCSLWIKLLFYWSNATFSIISVEFSGEGRNTYTKSMCTLKYLIFLMVVHIFYVGKMTQHIRNGSLGLQLWLCNSMTENFELLPFCKLFKETFIGVWIITIILEILFFHYRKYIFMNLIKNTHFCQSWSIILFLWR